MVARVFHDPQGVTEQAREYLEDWSTSSGGPIGSGIIDVEAERVGNDESLGDNPHYGTDLIPRNLHGAMERTE